jgi:hypothetical protein
MLNPASFGLSLGQVCTWPLLALGICSIYSRNDEVACDYREQQRRKARGENKRKSKRENCPHRVTIWPCQTSGMN